MKYMIGTLKSELDIKSGKMGVLGNGSKWVWVEMGHFCTVEIGPGQWRS
jgi:hypothetical protein